MPMKHWKRPTKKWWKSCKEKTKGEDTDKVCGAIWKRISPAKKKRIRKKKEGFRGKS